MKFLSRSASKERGTPAPSGNRAVDSYESVILVRSKAIPAVTYTINRISFGRRMELSRRARDISKRAEFLEAGGQLHEKIEAGILAQEVDAMYLTWGLVSIAGLTIDGEAANAERLIDKGPDQLAREIVESIKQQCGLSDAERKN